PPILNRDFPRIRIIFHKLMLLYQSLENTLNRLLRIPSIKRHLLPRNRVNPNLLRITIRQQIKKHIAILRSHLLHHLRIIPKLRMYHSKLCHHYSPYLSEFSIQYINRNIDGMWTPFFEKTFLKMKKEQSCVEKLTTGMLLKRYLNKTIQN